LRPITAGNKPKRQERPLFTLPPLDASRT